MDNAGKLQKFLQTLADTSRLKILNCIGKGESSVSEIVRFTELSQPLVSHHLRNMKDNGILETDRKGPFVYYRLKSPQLMDVLGVLSYMSHDVGDDISEDCFFRCPPWWHKKFSRRKM